MKRVAAIAGINKSRLHRVTATHKYNRNVAVRAGKQKLTPKACLIQRCSHKKYFQTFAKRTSAELLRQKRTAIDYYAVNRVSNHCNRLAAATEHKLPVTYQRF